MSGQMYALILLSTVSQPIIILNKRGEKKLHVDLVEVVNDIILSVHVENR